MEFTWMNYSSSIDRNNIYGWCYDSSMKYESISKISEKSLISITWNFGNYAGKWIIYQWLAR
jgi:hypothetical protein